MGSWRTWREQKKKHSSPDPLKSAKKSILWRVPSLARIQLFIFIVCNSEVQLRKRELFSLANDNHPGLWLAVSDMGRCGVTWTGPVTSEPGHSGAGNMSEWGVREIRNIVKLSIIRYGPQAASLCRPTCGCDAMMTPLPHVSHVTSPHALLHVTPTLRPCPDPHILWKHN